MTPEKAGFRPEIQGLRAVAIGGVVAFHAWPEALPGGFAGVDVFFVLSGYLITTIIRKDALAGRFSIAAFYARRVARLFPALFIMLAVVAAAAYMLLPPPQLASFIRSLSSSASFVANLHFGREVDYFADSADLQPLLHTWSLAIEEQFYLLYPLLLVGVLRFAPKRQWMVLAAVAGISLVHAVTVAIPAAGEVTPFYSPYTRAYELLVGCILALGFNAAPASPTRANAAVAIGMALIVAAFVLFSPGTDMPGWHALIPCAGTALVIYAAPNASAALLSPLTSRPARLLGDISYSLYLWHWPILVFARLVTVGELAPAETFFCVACALVLALMSYRLVERPVLRRTWEPAPVLGVAFGLVLVAAAPNFTGWGRDGLPGRFSPQSLAQFEDRHDYSPLRERCHARLRDPTGYAGRCELGANVPPDTAIWTDSIGVEFAHALGLEYREAGRSLRQVTGSSCPPMLDEPRLTAQCRDFNGSVFDHLMRDRSVTRVVLAAHYLGYEGRGQAGLDATQIASGVLKTATRLQAAGKKVVILAPVPGYDVPVPQSLGVMTQLGLPPEGRGIAWRRFEAKRHDAMAILREGAGTSGMTLVDLSPVFCTTSRCRVGTERGEALYFDSYHPSNAAAAMATQLPALRRALGLEPAQQEQSRPRLPRNLPIHVADQVR